VYVREITIDGLKLLREFTLDFTRDGEPRMWTVLVGRNGLCKTSILRALALAASGDRTANELSSGWRSSAWDRRRKAALEIKAEFDLPAEVRDPSGLPLVTEILMRPGERHLLAHSFFHPSDAEIEADREAQHEALIEYEKSAVRYDQRAVVAKDESSAADRAANELDRRPGDTDDDEDEWFEIPLGPLETARQQGRSRWFVAGYGVGRSLPNEEIRKDDRITIRCESLFDKPTLIATNFAEHLKENFGNTAAKLFLEALRAVVSSQEQLMPGVRYVGARASAVEPFTKGPLFEIDAGEATLSLPAKWLSHGYQSTLAWIADLIGHIIWDEFANGPPEPSWSVTRARGLVLIDELDLHLHPSWQVALIPALKQTFPKLQFVVTTHSPMLLAGLEADEIVMLDQDPETGDIVPRSDPRPAKLMTGTELLERYFNVRRLYPVNLSKQMYEYGRLASDPERTDQEDAEVQQIYRELEAAGVAPDWQPIPRKIR
jgi:predicted ATP-dependent endonuclease of OLD family